MGTVADSILSRNVVVEPGATVRGCVIMTGCVIGRGARVENAIIDRDNVVSAGTELRGTPDNVLVKEKGSEREWAAGPAASFASCTAPPRPPRS